MDYRTEIIKEHAMKAFEERASKWGEKDFVRAKDDNRVYEDTLHNLFFAMFLAGAMWYRDNGYMIQAT